MRKRQRTKAEVNAGSTADIAFLLLIFFLATTTILQEKGLSIKLPPDENDSEAQVHERNVFNIRVNSQNQVMVNDEVKNDLSGVPAEIKKFVLNLRGNVRLAESPAKAIISLKTNRGTRYEKFIEVLDMIKLAYFEMYGDRVGLSADQFRQLDHKKAAEYQLYLKGKEGLPMNISIAEPTI